MAHMKNTCLDFGVICPKEIILQVFMGGSLRSPFVTLIDVATFVYRKDKLTSPDSLPKQNIVVQSFFY